MFKAHYIKLTLLLACTLTSTMTQAQGYLKEIPVPDVSAELEAFEVADGFEVNLFASEPMIANPIHMNWDAEGRLWVVGSAIYPYIAPGDASSDTITILEDTNADGAADKSTVFAEGLFIPTGILPGDGGVYVSNSTELLHLKDEDGDGKADTRHVVLSGFGTEDTHHILHTLYWGVDGSMYMNQSIYIHSHVETPYGVKRLNAGGIWRFRPRDLQLDVLCYGFVNTWGHKQDYWGQSFATDGAYGEGINYVFPDANYITSKSPNAARILHGLNSGQPKHCGLEIISGEHFPDDWQGNMITNDFRAHRVCRFVVEESGTAYTSVEQEEVLKTTHGAFRPVDNKMGPDGALYIADWYNPIIQHGEVDFRDPRRDHAHGRIWRVQAKDRPLLKPKPIVGAPIPKLLNNLKSKEEWVRTASQRELLTRNRNKVLSALSTWLHKLKPGKPDYEHHRLMALWTYQTLDEPHQALLEDLLNAEVHQARAAAVRVLSHWGPDLYSEADYHAKVIALTADEHPRVRLEAVRILGSLNSMEGVEKAFAILEEPMDRFTDHALWLTARETAPIWFPMLESGDTTLTDNFKKFHFLLTAISDQRTVKHAFAYLENRTDNIDEIIAMGRLVVDHGSVEDAQRFLEFLLQREEDSNAKRAEALKIISEAAQRRNQKNPTAADTLLPMLETKSFRVVESVLQLLGAWGVEDARAAIQGIAEDPEQKSSYRKAAIDALAQLGEEKSINTLKTIVQSDAPQSLRVHSTAALARVDIKEGVSAAVAILESMDTESEPASILNAFMQRDGGTKQLAEGLANRTIHPDIAKRGERTLSSSGGKHEELIDALRLAGGLGASAAELTPESLAALVEQVNTLGDPARGEIHYRALDCAQCHAIGGGGGSLGPDMSSIGGSAPVDYLVESMLYPNKAIKEGYHSVIVETSDFESYSGITVSESATELVLRTATTEDIRIDKSRIDSRQNGLSLMPSGLTDGLLEQEFLDLVRFLAALGKDGDFSVGTARTARTWRTLEAQAEASGVLQGNSFNVLLGDAAGIPWKPLYASPNGNIPLDVIPVSNHRTMNATFSVLQCDIEVSQEGSLPLELNLTEGTQIWIGQESIAPDTLDQHSFPVGTHRLTLVLDRKQHRDGTLRLEMGEARDIDGHGAFILGR